MQRILIIDDNPIFRRTVEAILSARFPGLEIFKAQTSAGAFRVCQKEQPALVLMDINLSRINGFELLKSIRTRWPHIHVAVITDKDTREYQQASYNHGANYFFSKTSGNGRMIIRAVCDCLTIGGDCPAAGRSAGSAPALRGNKGLV
jgi:DNA-binding NarL/FixJ family response regulator